MKKIGFPKSISSVLGRTDSPEATESSTTNDIDPFGCLILDRQDGSVGDRVAIRLAEDVDRANDLSPLLQSGIVIEVMKVEPSNEDQAALVRLGIRAPKGFAIDRLENLETPRRAFELSDDSIDGVRLMPAEEVEKLSLHEVEDALTNVGEKDAVLSAQLQRLRRDKAKAGDRGYNSTSNKQYSHYLMLSEELDAVMGQLRLVEIVKKQLSRRIKQINIDRNREAQDDWARRFNSAAKEVLSDEEYERIAVVARKASD